MNTLKRYAWIIIVFVGVAGCAIPALVGVKDIIVTTSIVSSNDILPETDYSKQKFPYHAGIVIPYDLREVSPNATHRQGGSTWHYEFKLGHDFSQVSPQYFGSLFENVVVLKEIENKTEIDLFLVPDISSSYLAIYKGLSYRLIVDIQINVIKDGKSYNTIDIVESTGAKIPFLARSDEARTMKLMKADYEKLMKTVFQRLSVSLREIFLDSNTYEQKDLAD